MRVELASQVLEFLRSLPPEPRRLLRRALRDLARERGDVKQLESPLEDYCRLRVRDYRIIVRYSSRRTVRCLFIERRSLVYELFADALRAQLAAEPEDDSDDP